MKKTISILLLIAMAISMVFAMTACGDSAEKIIVQTNAFFAPFEYYDGTEITGVDVEVMNMVGEKMGKEIEFVNVEFAAIIDNVAAGKVCDCGAAGITITDARKEKVDFSVPYYTSVQYVIWAEGDDSIVTVNDEYVLWDALAGKKIGVQ
ncbi:MAG: transporter substrate-binding domain-containing protein, partial [Clostridia bacterium]|nr:transporter substrate-binding domain-containing protein [Clostridia bacterium]